MNLEKIIADDLHAYLMEKNELEKCMPDMTDIEMLWKPLAEAYIPDGIREFAAYPMVSMGWMMYIGMAVAKYWDTDWEMFSSLETPYDSLKNPRGYDCMDEYIREDILGLSGDEFKFTEDLVQECAARTNAHLLRSHIEPGTKEAFHAYVSCLHQLYLMGAAVELYRMGYRMVKA